MNQKNIYNSWIVRILVMVLLLSFGILLDYLINDIITIQGLFTVLFLFAGMIVIEYARGGSFHTAGFPLTPRHCWK